MNYIKKFFSLIKIFLYKTRYGKSLSIKRGYLIDKSASIGISNNGKIILNNVNAQKNAIFDSNGGILRISNSSINYACKIVCQNNIEISDGCLIGPNVCIFDHDHKFCSELVSTSEFNTGTIFIGKNCWIGANSVILKNTNIGEGCVIGAGTIVHGVIPAHSIVKSNRELIIEDIR